MDLNIDKSKCSRCGICERVCLLVINFGFSSIEEAPEEFCISCGQCASHCPENAISSQKFPTVPLADGPNPMELLNLIKNNRTLRQFRKKALPQDLWDSLKEAAAYSSSSMNFQEVVPIFIQDKNVIKDLSTLAYRTLIRMKKLYRFFLSRLVLQWVLSPLALSYLKLNAQREGQYPQQRDPVLYDAPGMILFSGPKNLISAKDDCDIMAVNMNLLAASYGLGGCYIGSIVHAMHLGNTKLKRWISLPKGYQIYQAMILGYPKWEKQRLPHRTANILRMRSLHEN